jgi:hypothetical protein
MTFKVFLEVPLREKSSNKLTWQFQAASPKKRKKGGPVDADFEVVNDT